MYNNQRNKITTERCLATKSVVKPMCRPKLLSRRDVFVVYTVVIVVLPSKYNQKKRVRQSKRINCDVLCVELKLCANHDAYCIGVLFMMVLVFWIVFIGSQIWQKTNTVISTTTEIYIHINIFNSREQFNTVDVWLSCARIHK